MSVDYDELVPDRSHDDPVVENHRQDLDMVGDGLELRTEEEYDRYWCYPKGAALHAVLLWDTDTQDEPVGWTKSYDGRYHGEAKT